MATKGKYISGLHRIRGNPKTTTPYQRKSIDRYQTGRGYNFQNRKNAKNVYKVRVRILDRSFNWLDWWHPKVDLWDFVLNYTNEFMDWVYRRHGIDLKTCGFNDFVNFALDSGLVTFEGNVPYHAYAKVRAILLNFKNILENSENF